jgi:hypothetical protein
VAPRNYFIPNINMRKLEGKDPITWIIPNGAILLSTPSAKLTKGTYCILIFIK